MASRKQSLARRGTVVRAALTVCVSVALCGIASSRAAEDGEGRTAEEEAARIRSRIEGSAPATVERSINFNFDAVEVESFVKLAGDITGRKFVISEGVTGRITVVSPKISRDEVYPLFVKILESAGCSVVRDGDVDRIVSLPDGAALIAPVVGADGTIPGEGLVTKIFRLSHVSVGQVRQLLESRIGGGKTGSVGAIEDTNHLVVSDTAENLRRIERILQEIDRPGLAWVTEVVPLKFAGAQELADELTAAMTEEETRGQALKRRLPSVPGAAAEGSRKAAVVASPHANSLILVGAVERVAELRKLIERMDVDTPQGRGRLNAIFLKYIGAEEAANSLNGLLGKTEEKEKQQGVAPRRIAIEASVENNALLVDAGPSDFELLKKLVEQLDQETRQVLIEVLIADVSMTDSLDLGVEMAAIDLPGMPGDTVLQGASTLSEGSETLLNILQQGIFPGGMTVGIAHGTRVDAEGNVVVSRPGVINVNAIKKDSRFQIRANPTLMAQNNKEASVSIVNEIPILTSTIEGGAGTSRDVIQNIDRIDVGIKLKLTPHVIPGGEVRMDLNPSIEAVTDPGPEGSQFTPTIAKREVSTTVTVPDGETIVIAGLIREDRTKIVRKVPGLGSLPLIGWLFRSTVEGTEKTNMLIFVTPTVINDSATAAEVRSRLEARAELDADEEE